MKKHFAKYYSEIILKTPQEKETLYKSLAKFFLLSQAAMSLHPKKISFAVSFTLAKSLKSFSDGENIIKKCFDHILKFANVNQKTRKAVKNAALSHQTVSRHTSELGKVAHGILKKQLQDCQFFSLAFDEATNVNDLAQLSIFVRFTTDEMQ
ncbi:hypothetical protein A3Q56_07761 [Intoshia linei]|uniref:DUF4371 domain-containing protein n=1 Tax=Intoshia linei TaxID=1819745 RepID=A0A177ATH7_9BILA|nr:hypothetical protein A3Q56_07761 [Intoshia linei]